MSANSLPTFQDVGLAQVFESTMPKPVQILEQYRQSQIQNQGRQQELKQKQLDNLRKQFDYNPKSELYQYTDTITNRIKAYQDRAAEIYGSSTPPTTEQEFALLKEKAEIEGEVNKTKTLKETISNVFDIQKTDKEGVYNWGKINTFLSSQLFEDVDEDGNTVLRSLGDIDPAEITKVLTSPEFINTGKVAKRFVESLGTSKATSISGPQSIGGATFVEKSEMEASNLFMRKPGTNEIIYDDETLLPRLNIGPQLLESIKSDEFTNLAFQGKKRELAARSGLNPDDPEVNLDKFNKEAMEELFRDYAGIKEVNKSLIKTKSASEYQSEMNFNFGRGQEQANTRALIEDSIKIATQKDNVKLGRLVDNRNVYSAEFTDDNKLVLEVPKKRSSANGMDAVKLLAALQAYSNGDDVQTEDGSQDGIETTVVSIDLTNDKQGAMKVANILNTINPKKVDMNEFSKQFGEVYEQLMESDKQEIDGW